ncbi:MAG: lysophospholipid acyltransferase family protein [Bacteroidia bacterium]|nr:lysophospholipid acyltransferase family protein [Bacteroidia bacterium]
MSRILYYLILKPLSMLPMWVLYRLSDAFALLFRYIIPYRRKVIMTNLERSFPEKSYAELLDIRNKFYDHLCDLIVESIKAFSMSRKLAMKMFKVTNPEFLDRYHDQGKHVIVASGHYGNWEYGAVAGSIYTKHDIHGLYSPLSDKFLNAKISESRCAFGTHLVDKNQFGTLIKTLDESRLFAITFIADQSATYAKNVYWTNFLNQDTPVMLGTEKYARMLNLPVLYGGVRKPKRGYYELTYELLVEDPSKVPYGNITEAHTKRLEQEIRHRPELWLWTHRRWKRQRVSADE